jgi:chitin synthase
MYFLYISLSRFQLTAAKVLSSIYGLVMMAVLVGILLLITQNSPLAPASLFFFILVGAMVIAALLHPQEFWCLLTGVVFFVTIPSMYMLLVVYAIFNLNDVSWGTREEDTKKSKMVRHLM